MLPYTSISPSAAFSAAFRTVGMQWAVYIVAIGALLGIVTGAELGALSNSPVQFATSRSIALYFFRLFVRSGCEGIGGHKTTCLP